MDRFNIPLTAERLTAYAIERQNGTERYQYPDTPPWADQRRSWTDAILQGMGQIPESEIHAAFLRIYHKLRLHGEPILKQMICDLQSIRERRMLWSEDIIELNKRISDISDQDRMLADMNKYGLVDPDIFISQSNELAQQLRAAKQEREHILGAETDDTLPRTKELLETLEVLPEFLSAFDGEIFMDLVDRITAGTDDTLRFRLQNGLELTETIERSIR